LDGGVFDEALRRFREDERVRNNFKKWHKRYVKRRGRGA
jgi:hypothetical protein